MKMHQGFGLTAVLAVSVVFHPRIETTAEAVEPLRQAHAHNDYLHRRPLLDALEHGFNSVEADIFLVEGALLVGHSKQELKNGRTLESLYLEPLRQRIRANAGSVFRDAAPFHLLIDIKSEASSTYAVLDKVLEEYGDIVSIIREGHRDTRAVNVVVSGNRPIDVFEKQAVLYAGLDGRWGDLDSEVPSDRMPLISDNWGKHFQWRGQGAFDEREAKQLASAIAKAHAHGRKIRFWATPDTPPMWDVLRASGVDMINTDDLAGLEKFLREQPVPARAVDRSAGVR